MPSQMQGGKGRVGPLSDVEMQKIK